MKGRVFEPTVILTIAKHLFIDDVLSLMLVCKRFWRVLKSENVFLPRVYRLLPLKNPDGTFDLTWDGHGWDTSLVERVFSTVKYMILKEQHEAFITLISKTKQMTHLKFGLATGPSISVSTLFLEIPSFLLHFKFDVGILRQEMNFFHSIKAPQLQTFCIYGNSVWSVSVLHFKRVFPRLRKLHFYASVCRAELMLPETLEEFHFSVLDPEAKMPSYENCKNLRKLKYQVPGRAKNFGQHPDVIDLKSFSKIEKVTISSGVRLVTPFEIMVKLKKSNVDGVKTYVFKPHGFPDGMNRTVGYYYK